MVTVISVPDRPHPSDSYGGLTISDLNTGETRYYVDLNSVTHNPQDIAFHNGWAILSNTLSFDAALTDYRLTVLELSTFKPIGFVQLPNPFLSSPDASLSPQMMTVVGPFLFVVCTGFSFSSYAFENPGSVAVIDLRTFMPVDTDGDPLNGITPLFTSIPNPSSIKHGPDGELYVLCGGNFGAFTGDPVIPGGVDVFEFPSLTRKTSLSFAGDAATPFFEFTPDGRAYVGDGVSPYIYSFDPVRDIVLRDYLDPIILPQRGPLGYVSDIAFEEDGSVIALNFNEDKAYTWFLNDDIHTGDPGVRLYADLDPLSIGFFGPQWLVEVPVP